MPRLAKTPNLSELVIYPVVCTDLFVMALRDVTFKKLILLQAGILMITENELNMLFQAISESCPKLESMKIDIQALRAD